jgi:hypothetical protein
LARPTGVRGRAETCFAIATEASTPHLGPAPLASMTCTRST